MQTPFNNSALSNTPVLVAGNTVVITYLDAFNADEACYVHLFDAKKASDVTLGVSIPKLIWGVPKGGGHDLEKEREEGVYFGLGLVIACTTTPTGTTAPATGANVNVLYDNYV
jgi:hypothetical protein